MKNSGKKKRGIGHILFGLTARTMMLAAAGLLVLSYLSMLVNPAKAWFMTIFGLLFLPFLLLNLFILVWALKRRSGAFAIPLLALIPAFFLFGRYVQFNGGELTGSDGTVKMVSYNVGSFALYKDNSGLDSSEACADSVFAFLRNSDADIISLQEVSCGKGVDVKEFVNSHLPGYNVEFYTSVDGHGSHGNVILSRYPVLRKGKFDFEDSANLAFYVDLDIHGEALRVYDCHFQSYNISVPRVLDALSKKDDAAVQQAEEKMRSSITRRPQQVGIILKDIKESPLESIVTGDFNDTPMSYTYFQLKQGKKDSFVEAGKGMGGTYSLLRPFVRIDYVLFPQKYDAVAHKVFRLKWSDHYPIETELKI